MTDQNNKWLNSLFTMRVNGTNNKHNNNVVMEYNCIVCDKIFYDENECYTHEEKHDEI